MRRAAIFTGSSLDNMKGPNILISRIDAIGDVTLTLPTCGYLKSIFPESTIFFLGRSYTKPVLDACCAIDQFINYDELYILSENRQIEYLKDLAIDTIIHVFPNRHLARLAKKSHIPLRVGTAHRWYHWFSCNKLVFLGRKNSNFHEAELNMRLLKGIGLTDFPVFNEIHRYYNLTKFDNVPEVLSNLLSKTRFNLILHPKSHGSGKEWSLNRYKELITMLPEEHYNIFISGSEKEKHLLKDWIQGIEKPVTDITGLMSLGQFIAFIKRADGLVACSTGPLHLAAALGINTLGLYPNVRPLHAGRWGPVGPKARYIKSGDSELDTIQASEVYRLLHRMAGRAGSLKY